MKCDEARRYLSPYLDSELDPTMTFEIARHLEQCAPCRERFEAEGRVERAVARELRRPEPGDPALWQRALARAAGRRRRWLWAAGLLVPMAAAAAVWLLAGRTDGLAADLRRDYLKHQAGDAPLDLACSDPEALSTFFRERMGLSVHVPVLEGWELLGGRKCALRGVPTAFVVYRGKGQTVSLCVFVADHLDRFDTRVPFMDEGTEVRVAAMRSGPHVVGAAGRLPCKDLLALCQAAR